MWDVLSGMAGKKEHTFLYIRQGIEKDENVVDIIRAGPLEGGMSVRKRLHRGGIAKNMSEGDLVTGGVAGAPPQTAVMIGIRADISEREGEVMCEECGETTQSVVTPGGKFFSHRMKRTMMPRRNKWQAHAT